MSDDNSIQISFDFAKNESQYYKCQLLVNGIVLEDKYCDSLTSVRIRKRLSDFSFRICADERMPGRFLDTLDTETFNTATNVGNNLSAEVVVNDSLFNYRVFNDEIIKVSNKKLRIFSNSNQLLLFRERKRKQ